MGPVGDFLDNLFHGLMLVLLGQSLTGVESSRLWSLNLSNDSDRVYTSFLGPLKGSVLEGKWIFPYFRKIQVAEIFQENPCSWNIIIWPDIICVFQLNQSMSNNVKQRSLGREPILCNLSFVFIHLPQCSLNINSPYGLFQSEWSIYPSEIVSHH